MNMRSTLKLGAMIVTGGIISSCSSFKGAQGFATLLNPKPYTVTTPVGFECSSQEPLADKNAVKVHFQPTNKSKGSVGYSETFVDANNDKNLTPAEQTGARLVVDGKKQSIAYDLSVNKGGLVDKAEYTLVDEHGSHKNVLSFLSGADVRRLAEESANDPKKVLRLHAMNKRASFN